MTTLANRLWEILPLLFFRPVVYYSHVSTICCAFVTEDTLYIGMRGLPDPGFCAGQRYAESRITRRTHSDSDREAGVSRQPEYSESWGGNDVMGFEVRNNVIKRNGQEVTFDITKIIN